MYNAFFGFKERPFKLVPNPDYLYLGKSHEVALAHLTYAVSQGDGFVEITGEVGTGKTTLCRAFLETLDKDTEAAYIFNPKLNEIQLLKAINEEFNLDSDPDNVKDLIDILNVFLMQKRMEGKQVLILIDEAQNLTREVLEQLRLLSNLETTSSKLLQIILVGQPELGHLLDSHELRQVGQRISLSCHLVPLNRKETADYIRHRIQVAALRPTIRFTRSAYDVIHRFSRGVPRLINIACDRTLLTAYGLGQKTITGAVAKTAVREIAGRGDVHRRSLFGTWKRFFAAVVLIFFAGGLFWWGGPEVVTVFKTAARRLAAIEETSQTPPPEAAHVAEPADPLPSPPPVTSGTETEPFSGQADGYPAVPDDSTAGVSDRSSIPTAAPESPTPEAVPDTVPAPSTESSTAYAVNAPPAEAAPAPPPSVDASYREPGFTVDESPPPFPTFAETLEQLVGQNSRRFAVKEVLRLWDPSVEIKPYLDTIEDDAAFFETVIRQNNLTMQIVEADLRLVWKLNLPAIFEFFPPSGTDVVYMALTRIRNDRFRFQAGHAVAPISVTESEADRYWTGRVLVPWRNFYAFAGVIPREATEESLLTLKKLIAEIGYEPSNFSPVYDPDTRQAVRTVQRKHGLKVDGYVGPLTKIILYNELESLNIPHIRG